MTSEHDKIYCPRCKAAFFCTMDDIRQCQCTTVALSTETRSFLSATFYDCLSKSCLAEINQQVKRPAPTVFQAGKNY